MLTMTYPTTPTIGELATQLLGIARGGTRKRGGQHITGESVHGGSKEAGGFEEEAFYARLDDMGRKARRRSVNELFERGRALLRELRKSPRELSLFERQCTRITNGAVRVYGALLRMEKVFRGRVFPSYELIAEWAHVSRATVHRALGALEEVGLLQRLRRYVYTKSGEAGARSEQTSNAYRLELPKMLRALLERRFRPAPLPADEAQRQRDRLADHADMLRSLSRADYIRATTADAGLAKVLVSLLGGIDAADPRSS